MTPGAPAPTEGANPLTLAFDEEACQLLRLTGGKGASLSELARAGLPVPAGFVVTTSAFATFMASLHDAADHLARLQALAPTDTAGIREAASAFRAFLQEAPVPAEVADGVLAAYDEHGGQARVAVRSSATLEDLDSASFAGQHATYLGVDAGHVVERVRACWVSLFADNAVAYRRRNRLHERDAQMAVVVQRMAAAQSAGVLFTVDPLTGRRDHCAIDANWGLGESVVSGQVNPDHYVVDPAASEVITVDVGEKELAIVPAGDGVQTITLDEDRRRQRVLSDAQLLELVALGKQLEQLKGAPQDIEWCFDEGPDEGPDETADDEEGDKEGDKKAEGRAVLLQSRPITSLFPRPTLDRGDGVLRAYMCIGHQQANPAAFSPFMCGLLRWVVPFARDDLGRSALVTDAGHRAYLDITGAMLTFPLRNAIPRVMDEMSPAIAQRARAIRDRPDFVRARGRVRFKPLAFVRLLAPAFPRAAARMFLRTPERVKDDWAAFIERHAGVVRDALARAEKQAEPVAAVIGEVTQLMSGFFLAVMPVMAIPVLLPGILSTKILTRLMKGRVDSIVIDQVLRGLDGNIVTEMDLAIGDAADLLQADAALLQEAWSLSDDDAVRRFVACHASTPFVQAFEALVEAYGHRAPGELDVGVARWSERPHTLLQVVLGKTQVAPGEHRRRHAEGVKASQQAEALVFAAAARGWLGFLRLRLARFFSRRARAYYAMREHHKYLLIVTIAHVRQAILGVGRRGARAGWLKAPEDVFLLRPEELLEGAVRAPETLMDTVERRRADHERFSGMFPPAILLSTGEVPVAAPLDVEAPAGALVGAPVSAGVVTGRARVLRHPSDDMLEPGDILVAPFTDAAWTTLFVHAGAVVLEAGGIMSHGSVIAREYGIPGVAGVPDATRKITTGQRLRVDGDRGIVEVIGDEHDDAS